ncbi:unnamed protein product [Caenorhabditis angaria]|uniref:Cyclin N-terminal domain-containing protein n=1 Tax=Caenorhabditis angaria TaxID=860376 RepID=A0A9P1II86_9PELO|nr:unnamed protein product [Caenorhabditis angaria]
MSQRHSQRTPKISRMNSAENANKIFSEEQVVEQKVDEGDDRDVDFHEIEGSLHMINWQDCLAQLSSDIIEYQSNAEASDWSFMKPAIIQYLFTICIRLRLPNEVRYTAALIFNVYMRRQIMQLYQFLEDQDMSAAQKSREWEKIETNAERQIPLRLLSAVQISSKIHSYHDSLSSRQVVNCLRSLSLPYTLSAVQNSEIRVFRTIGHKPPESPLTVCETAIKILAYSMRKHGWADDSKFDMIWQHVLVVLDVCMINHADLYDKFMARRPRNNFSAKDDPAVVLAKFKWDFLMLSISVIQTAILCVIGRSCLPLISKVLVKILHCDERNCQLLHESIVEMIEERR